MDIKESKELSFDTQDFPKEVWVFDADNLDQGTEISHLMMSHAEQYTKDELLEICRQASMVIDQLRAELAKAQAVPNLGELQERIAGHQYYHDEHGHMIVDMDDVVKEISSFDSCKAQAVPEGFVLVSAEQLNQWGHMANCAEEYGCPECFEARGYAHSLACEINAYFNVSDAQEPAND